MRVLVACEFSGTVRDAFIAKGHDAWSCDLLPTDKPGPHIQGNVLEVLDQGWHMMIAHPPCTYLTRAGWHWVNKPDCSTLPLKGEPRRKAAFEAAEFFRMLIAAPILRIAIENPKPICHVHLPPYTQIIQPWMFGHGESKGTCLWLKGLPKLEPTHRKDDLFAQQEPDGRDQRLHRLPPSPDRWKLRSVTYPGIAKAMSEQWT